MLLFCNEWQTNEQRIITHARTVIALFTFALVLCLFLNSVKPNGKRMNSQTNTKQTKAQPNKSTAGGAENILAMERLPNTKTYVK